MLKVGSHVAVALALLVGLAISARTATAAEVSASTVQVGGVSAALLRSAHPRGAIILLAGGDGYIGVGADGAIAREGNQLVRTRMAYAARGFAVLVPDCCVDLTAAVAYMGQYGRVTVVGTSRGTQRAARGIAAGARPTRLVLTSGFLSDASGDGDNVMRILGSPDALPPTLIVEHRHDECRKTLPDGVKPFLDWAGRRAHAVWLDGGESEGDPCEAWAHHGFNGIDMQVVSAVASFAAR
ncbi:MAG: alpha/beta hydrolase [Roseiarcus sp.]